MTRKEEIEKKAVELYPDHFYSSIAQKFGAKNVDNTDKREVFVIACEWADKTIIEKACDWLKTHINDYLVKGRDIDYMFDDFRNAIEE